MRILPTLTIVFMLMVPGQLYAQDQQDKADDWFLEIGVGMSLILPSSIKGFDETLPLADLKVAFNIWDGALEAEGHYWKKQDLNIIYAGAAYRFDLDPTVFPGFVSMGVHACYFRNVIDAAEAVNIEGVDSAMTINKPDVGVNFGGGVFLPLKPKILFKPEIRIFIRPGVALTLGGTFLFRI